MIHTFNKGGTSRGRLISTVVWSTPSKAYREEYTYINTCAFRNLFLIIIARLLLRFQRNNRSLGRWLKNSLKLTGANTTKFKIHNTRVATISAAKL